LKENWVPDKLNIYAYWETGFMVGERWVLDSSLRCEPVASVRLFSGMWLCTCISMLNISIPFDYHPVRCYNQILLFFIYFFLPLEPYIVNKCKDNCTQKNGNYLWQLQVMNIIFIGCNICKLRDINGTSDPVLSRYIPRYSGKFSKRRIISLCDPTKEGIIWFLIIEANVENILSRLLADGRRTSQ
jgi:hypothetical protein